MQLRDGQVRALVKSDIMNICLKSLIAMLGLSIAIARAHEHSSVSKISPGAAWGGVV